LTSSASIYYLGTCPYEDCNGKVQQGGTRRGNPKSESFRKKRDGTEAGHPASNILPKNRETRKKKSKRVQTGGEGALGEEIRA